MLTVEVSETTFVCRLQCVFLLLANGFDLLSILYVISKDDPMPVLLGRLACQSKWIEEENRIPFVKILHHFLKKKIK